MVRIKQRVCIMICCICILLFLTTYFFLSRSIPVAKESLKIIENKMKFLKIGPNQHDMEIKGVMDHIETAQNKFLMKEYEKNVINVESELCFFDEHKIPEPEIQMLKLYENLSFADVDGGPWKQGWPITYDYQEITRNKLKVFIVPHSHNDPGWLKTFDEYYESETKLILSNMLRHLTENPHMTFIWAEISYFSRWFASLSDKTKNIVKNLVNRGQLEFVTGGWVMPDEANTHWINILVQLIEGQTWLKTYLNTTPESSWSIDPFGQSPTMAYILKNSGFQNLLIQRVHYSVKKKLARDKDLEFFWRQIWDDTKKNDLFTHMMPFYSYDIPHTCGPDPKVCCQFDFKRLPRFGVTCPWGKQPEEITENNVASRAKLLLDQWRKKSTLYKTQSLLIPLGDDFRYMHSTEWDVQRKNYEKLFEYMNNDPSLYVEAKFGTLQEYFNSVRKENTMKEFSSLTGDFFTYADRNDHYWSGYYTSRPYYKRMDRVLLHYLRSAELLYTWRFQNNQQINQYLQQIRQNLSLFQHHDGITGTAKTHVVHDYAIRMRESIKLCKFVMQQSVYRLLTKTKTDLPKIQETQFIVDDSHWPGNEEMRTTIVLGEEVPPKHVVFHNSLPKWRVDVVELYVSKPYIKVTDNELNTIRAQISPAWSWHKNGQGDLLPQHSTTKFRLIFEIRVPPLGLSTYIIHNSNQKEAAISTNFTTITIRRELPITSPYEPFQVYHSTPDEEFIKTTDDSTLVFNEQGLLKSILFKNTEKSIPINLEFLKYGVKSSHNVHSGAYLFLPDKEATKLTIGTPVVLISRGIFESSVTTGLPFVVHQTIVRKDKIEIRNFVDIGEMENTEIIMRITTNITSGKTFYTDLNAMQIIKRKHFSKLPIQANYYPIPSAIYIEDNYLRLTMLSAQPLGGSSLASGEIEIMQDRRLKHDDERGLGQGVLDNQPVLHIFRLILEKISSCKKISSKYPAGFLTIQAYNQLQNLLHPIDTFIWNENVWPELMSTFGNNNLPVENGFELGIIRYLPHITTKKNRYLGIVTQFSHLDTCDSEYQTGNINIKKLLNCSECEIYAANLTLLNKGDVVSEDIINICPMNVKAFIIKI